MTRPIMSSRRALDDPVSWRTRVQAIVAAMVVAATFVLFGSTGIAGATKIAPAGFCKRISAATVGALYGAKTPLLGAQLEGAGNDVCEFASFVNGAVSGATMNYDYKGTGSVASNLAALKKEKGVRSVKFKAHTSIGGTTYSFTDTFVDSATKKAIKESGMVSYNGVNHYGVIVTKSLTTTRLAQLLELVVKAA